MIVEIMVIRMTEWEFWDKFNQKHNPQFYEKLKKEIKEKIKKKNQEQEDNPPRFKIFRK